MFVTLLLRQQVGNKKQLRFQLRPFALPGGVINVLNGVLIIEMSDTAQ